MIPWTPTLKSEVAQALSVPEATIQFTIWPDPDRVSCAYVRNVDDGSELWAQFTGDRARNIVSLGPDEIRDLLA